MFEHFWENERERLAAIEGGLDAYSIACLNAIGVAPGWRCLEVGAGHLCCLRFGLPSKE